MVLQLYEANLSFLKSHEHIIEWASYWKTVKKRIPGKIRPLAMLKESLEILFSKTNHVWAISEKCSKPMQSTDISSMDEDELNKIK